MSARSQTRPKAVVVGSGPAGLMAAEILAQGGAEVTLYDAMPSPGRKFLLAGRGGLNLTHSEDFEALIAHYGAAAPSLRPAIEEFSPQALQAWCAELGEPTFIGTSGRVFPASFKASPLLRAWLRRLGALGVAFMPRHRWLGWDREGALLFEGPEGTVTRKPDATVLALGGASWPRLGSDGAWTKAIAEVGIGLAPLRPANCGFLVDWSKNFRERFAGQPVKGACFSFADQNLRGDAVITDGGIEGGAIYGLSADLREALLAQGEALLHIALRPDLTATEIEERLRRHLAGRKPSLSNLLRKALKLSPVAIGLLYEARLGTAEPLSALAPHRLAQLINAVPLRITGVAPIARAISTSGGILFDEIDESFMLRRKPGVFIAGEMLDWEAPTGGYLLQACFATGAAAGRGALKWLGMAALAKAGSPELMAATAKS
ncbi:MAG: TIGR03862 family flavoprotein [Methylovirgula sp.]